MSEQKKTGLELLREPFPPDQIELLPKPYKKESPKGNCKECGKYHGLPAAHLKYVGHAALTNRLLDVDPEWSWQPMGKDQSGTPIFDKDGGLWIELTICGVTRPGYGTAENASFKTSGNMIKEIIGDALRNSAMRFGAALDLWSKVDLYEEKEAEQKKPNAENKQKPFYSNEDFEKNFPAWEKGIKSGNNTAEGVIKIIEKAKALSDTQKRKIKAIK